MRNRQVRRDERASRTVDRNAHRPDQGRRGIPRRPEDGARWNALVTNVHTVRRDPRHRRAGAALNPEFLQILGGANRQRLGERWQQPRAALEQGHTNPRRIDPPEVAPDPSARDGREDPSQLYASGAAANDGERQ